MSGFEALVHGVIIAAVVALLATPLGWRYLAPLPRFRRALAISFACLGVSGLIGLAYHHLLDFRDGIVAVAVATSAALQGFALLLLLFFSPKRP